MFKKIGNFIVVSVKKFLGFLRKLFKLDTTEADAAEFQPDAIYLENQKPGIPLQAVWYLILLLFALGIIWACVTEVDKVVVAEGKIITTRAPLTIKPLERTIIEKVHVVAGERVKKGELLFTLDQTVNRTELSKLKERYSSLKAERLRLIAENENKPFVFDAANDPLGDFKLQSMIYEARKNYYNEKVTAYDENIEKTEKTIKSLTESRVKYIDRRNKVNQIAEMYESLHAKKVSSTKELLEAQATVLASDVQIDELDIQLMSYSHQLMITKAEKNSFVTDWKKNLVEELVSVDCDYLVTEREIAKYEKLVTFLFIEAPCDAVVHEIVPFQEGSAVREAESLITLIPLDVPLEAEVNVMAKDIGKVLLGDSARVKFDTYPFQQHGTLDGEVRYISQDAFEKGQNAAANNPRAAAEQKGSFYQVFLSLKSEFANPKNKILPGMRVVAEIKVGKRRVISYLINPFIKAMDEAIREP